MDKRGATLATTFSAIFGVALLFLHFIALAGFFDREVKIDSARQGEGHLFIAESLYPIGRFSWIFGVPTDSSNLPFASNLKLRDDLGDLGPPHASHDQIATRGGGAYSHWNNALLFSVRSSEAKLEHLNASFSPRLTLAGFAVAVLLLLPVAYDTYRRYRQSRPIDVIRHFGATGNLAWPLIAVAGSLYYYLLYDSAPGLLIWSDTASYLVFAPIVTAGYGLFLHAVIELAGTPLVVPAIQLALGLAAITALSWVLERAFGPIPALVAGFLLLAKGGLITLHFALVSDSLFVSCSILTLVLSWLVARRPSVLRLSALVLVLGLAYFIRPAALFLFAPVILLAARLFWIKRRISVLIVIGLLAIFGGARGTSGFVGVALNNSELDSALARRSGYTTEHTPYWGADHRAAGMQLGYMLYLQMRFALIQDHNDDEELGRVKQALMSGLHSERAAYESAPTLAGKFLAFEESYSSLTTKRVIRNLFPEEMASPHGLMFREDLLRRLAWDTISDQPLALVRISAIKLLHALRFRMLGAWVGERANCERSPLVDSWTNRYNFSCGVASDHPKSVQYAIQNYISPLVIFSSFAALVAVFPLRKFAMGGALPTGGTLLVLAGSAYWCYVAMIAIVQVPIWRYGEASAPFGLACLVGSLWLLYCRADRFWRSARSSGLRCTR